MRTIHPDGAPFDEPSPVSQYVLQDGEHGAFWNGQNPYGRAGWTRDIDRAHVAVGLPGIMAARYAVPAVFEWDEDLMSRKYRRARITYFRVLREPAEQKVVV